MRCYPNSGGGLLNVEIRTIFGFLIFNNEFGKVKPSFSWKNSHLKKVRPKTNRVNYI